MRRLAVVSVVAAAAVVLSACGGDHGAAHSGGSAAATIPQGADFGKGDVVFAQSMIPHHEQAIEMAEIALDPAMGAGPEVMALATQIKGAQGPEIELLTGWLTSWGQPMAMDMSDGHDMSAMEGMMSADEMKALGEATGAEFDRLWLEMMIAHHEGAIAMATDVKADSANADVMTLADQIIAAQQTEITEMKALLAG